MASAPAAAQNVLQAVPLGMNAWSLAALQRYSYKTSPVIITSFVLENNFSWAYNFSYVSMGKTISGRIRFPKRKDNEAPKGMVIMLRGHQYAAGYSTGKGTEYPGNYYLRSGYAVIAPDFLGYGSSDLTPDPEEAHQFYSTINAVELYLSLLSPDISFGAAVPAARRISLPLSFGKLVLWGHSNGGQTAIQALEILKRPVPTVLWAPVSLDFPDSAAFYREGRTGRRSEWADRFKQSYRAEDFSLSHYLTQIAGGTPLLLEQGTADTAVPKSWSDAFSGAIAAENRRRENLGMAKINLTYDVYQNADHNLQPYWAAVLQKDVDFWDAH